MSFLTYYEYVQCNVVLVYLVHSIAKLFNSSPWFLFALWFIWGEQLTLSTRIKVGFIEFLEYHVRIHHWGFLMHDYLAC